jgi:hypothetical protein
VVGDLSAGDGYAFCDPLTSRHLTTGGQGTQINHRWSAQCKEIKSVTSPVDETDKLHDIQVSWHRSNTYIHFISQGDSRYAVTSSARCVRAYMRSVPAPGEQCGAGPARSAFKPPLNRPPHARANRWVAASVGSGEAQGSRDHAAGRPALLLILGGSCRGLCLSLYECPSKIHKARWAT